MRTRWVPDVAKVVDFGLLKDVRDEQKKIDLTSPDIITGTPLYMAPEAFKDPLTVDAHSDLYALGAVGYYVVTGNHVFIGKAAVEVCSQHLTDLPESPSKRLEPISKILPSSFGQGDAVCDVAKWSVKLNAVCYKSITKNAICPCEGEYLSDSSLPRPKHHWRF
jgi:serine/threonine protein kinase